MDDNGHSTVIRTRNHQDNQGADAEVSWEQHATLRGDEHTGALPPGWTRPRPEHVPRPTYWPAVMGMGITMLGWGFITTPLISLVGVLLFAISLWAWIGEMHHEQ